jgi:4-hydroxybenzoate polyprenyltransferase
MAFKNCVALMRPHQWIKNSAVFAALIFSGNVFRPALLLKSAAAFLTFCLVSSCVYIINDIVDGEKDRLHPRKKNRPIASGIVSVGRAFALFALLLLIAAAIALFLPIQFAVTIAAYFTLNVAYSFRLKKLPLIDIICISFGFVCRTLSGAVAINVYISPWLMLCVLMLSLFLASQKRSSELSRHSTATDTRSVLSQYDKDVLRDISTVTMASTIISYSMFCVVGAVDKPLMALTIPLVIYGLFRYRLISANDTDNLTETPEIAMFKDKPLIISLGLWGAMCFALLYL